MSEPTDWKAMGLDFHSPFDILGRPRAVPSTSAQPPMKRGPKPRQTTREKVLASLREPGETNFNVPIMSRAESDRTLAIKGSTC